MDLSKIDLTKPAFGEGSQKVEDLEKVVETPAEETKTIEPEPIKEKEEEKEGEEISDEKPRVTYSRFKNVHQRAIEAEKNNAELLAKLAALENSPKETEKPVSEMPDWWKKLYGDSPESKDGWGIWHEQENQRITAIRGETLDALRQELRQEQESVKENLSTLDSHLEEVEAVAGHVLTEKEQSAVLDIIDEFTPKDNDGRYLGALISPDKAWEIYELKTKSADSQKRESRDKIAALTDSQSEGEPSAEQVEKNKNFNPLWGGVQEAFRKRFGNS